MEYIVHCCVTKYKIVLFGSFFLSFIFPFFFFYLQCYRYILQKNNEQPEQRIRPKPLAA